MKALSVAALGRMNSDRTDVTVHVSSVSRLEVSR
jgi:hypothetical protein